MAAPEQPMAVKYDKLSKYREKNIIDLVHPFLCGSHLSIMSFGGLTTGITIEYTSYNIIVDSFIRIDCLY